MNKKSIRQLILTGITPLFLLLVSPVHAADQSTTNSKETAATSKSTSDDTKKNPDAFEQGSGTSSQPTGPDTTPEMKQQQPHSVDQDSVTSSDKDTSTGAAKPNTDSDDNKQVTPISTRDANAADVTTSPKGASTDEKNVKLDEEYKKAIKDCDDQTHSTKNDCIAKVRTKYER